MGERTVEETHKERKVVELTQCDFCGLHEDYFDEDGDDFVDVVVNPRIKYRATETSSIGSATRKVQEGPSEEIRVKDRNHINSQVIGDYDKVLHLCPFCGPAIASTLKETKNDNN